MNTVLSVDLYNALKKVKITKISKIPVLNHVHLEFINGELLLTSTDLENTKKSKCPCCIEEEWSTCLPMQSKIDVSTTYKPVWHKVYTFMDFVEVCAEYKDILEFTFEPKIQTVTIKVRGERNTSTFKCIDSLEFPVIAVE